MKHSGANFLRTDLAALLLAGVAVFLSAYPAVAQDDGGGGFKYLEVKVLDPEGKPYTDADVEISIDGVDFPLATDEQGIVSFNVPSKVQRNLTLGVRHDGFVAVGARWRKGEKIPDEFTIALTKGMAIGGIVHDQQGEPIEGVEIEATTASGNSKPGELLPWFSGVIGTTDDQGRWRTETAPEKEVQIHLRLRHPDYVQDQNFGQHRATWAQLQSLDHVFVLEKGIEIRGRVLDPAGDPIADAKVAVGADRFRGSSFQTTETNEEGEYALKNSKAGNTVLTVYAEHWSPELRSVVAHIEMEPVDFQMEPGHSIRIRVTDPEGEPIAGVRIAPDTWRGHRSVGGVMPKFLTDASGVWESDSLPTDVIDYDILKQGHMAARDQNLAAQEEEHVIVMPNPLVVQGKVVDAETGMPLESFSIVQGMRWDRSNQNTHWERYNVKSGRNGEYRTVFDEPRFGHLVRIEAEGYRPSVSRTLKNDEGEVTIDFEMEEGSGPSGVVMMPSGEPADGAVVLMAVADQYIHINNGQFQQNTNSQRVVADAEGRFTLPFAEGDFQVVLLHDAGGRHLDGVELEASPEITLQPWARVEGKLMRGKEPLGGERVVLNFTNRHQRGLPNVNWSYNTQTDNAGAFAFERVRAGEATVARYISYGDDGQYRMGTYSHSQQVQIESGSTVQVQIGGEGRTLKGRLTVPEDYEGQVAWNMGLVRFSGRAQRSGVGNRLKALGTAIGLFGQTKAPATNSAQSKVSRKYAATIAEGGSFEIHDIVPGDYQMNVQILELPSGGNFQWNPIGTLNQAIAVAELEDGADDEPIDLGEFELTMTKPTPPAAQPRSLPTVPQPK